jgi:hypothetical protein
MKSDLDNCDLMGFDQYYLRLPSLLEVMKHPKRVERIMKQNIKLTETQYMRKGKIKFLCYNNMYQNYDPRNKSKTYILRIPQKLPKEIK